MLMSQLPATVAEGMNGALVFNLSFAVMMFGTYAIREVRLYGYRMRARAAISVGVMLFGDLILRSWFWIWRIQINDALSVAWMNAWPVVPLGQAIEMLGVLCLIRVFSADAWPDETWQVVGAISIIFAFVFAFCL